MSRLLAGSIPLVFILQVVLAPTSSAQTSTRPFGGSVPQGPAQEAAQPLPRDALNRPCVQADAIARPHTINPNMIDHVVSVKNICNRPLKLKVCYFGSGNCRDLNISGYGREDVIIGTMSNIRYFRYSITPR